MDERFQVGIHFAPRSCDVFSVEIYYVRRRFARSLHNAANMAIAFYHCHAEQIKKGLFFRIITREWKIFKFREQEKGTRTQVIWEDHRTCLELNTLFQENENMKENLINCWLLLFLTDSVRLHHRSKLQRTMLRLMFICLFFLLAVLFGSTGSYIILEVYSFFYVSVPE